MRSPVVLFAYDYEAQVFIDRCPTLGYQVSLPVENIFRYYCPSTCRCWLVDMTRQLQMEIGFYTIIVWKTNDEFVKRLREAQDKTTMDGIT